MFALQIFTIIVIIYASADIFFCQIARKNHFEVSNTNSNISQHLLREKYSWNHFFGGRKSGHATSQGGVIVFKLKTQRSRDF